MFTIVYKGVESGCPEGGVYGELAGYNWNSNNFEDDRFPPEGAILDFYALHKVVVTDFFYFGSEFICSGDFLALIKSSNCGVVDVREVRLHQESKVSPISSKKYYLVRSREIHKILDMEKSKYELRLDPITKVPEEDMFHPGRVIFDAISDFSIRKDVCDLDFFISSEMLRGEYVFSAELGEKIIKFSMRGVMLMPVSEFVYDAKLDF
ncbi:hypothetical protein [Pseudomonas sp. MAG733B]|uniref:Imm43 family immunity protein n=1 Tax=Pseudomonas sp. MAG733B TaxID=3122079 RepID=UPI0030D14A77